ncbi:MAG: HAD-IA family hydrolase [Anaerolineae bacterium]|nr:HAD-IA family hydrolase [Anaerolineae bacterium]
MLKAVLFDLDDTLLDWRGFQQEWPSYEQHMLRRLFDHVNRDEALLPDFAAFENEFRDRTREGWRNGRGTLIAPHLGMILRESVEAQGAPSGRFSVEECLRAYRWGAVPGTVIFPGVGETLQTLLDAGIKTAIVTNAYQPMWVRDVEIEQHGILHYFPECRISAADVGLLKPHPTIFEVTLRQLGVKPDEAVFVGDNPIADIAGGQGAGMRAVLRVTTPTPPMLSGLIVPDAAINELPELLPILDEWFPGWRA